MQTLYGMNASGVSTGETRQIDDQEGIEPGWVPAEPPALAAGEVAIWAATQWLVTPEPPPDVDGAKASQTALVSAACQAAIVAGFTSSALGAPHTYPAKPTDQQNLNASVVASILPGVAAGWTTPFWCADGSGTWAYVMHTAAQIQQVGQDGKAAILACLTKNQQLAAQIDAATTVEAVHAIVWS
ncbi:hypothetical protein [Paraburkholderia sp. DGU8]|uniref:DUF4376 domain-containing protein n=1 Tax=Paraburkholderia sp. DGU8 TaxID=3161997 RepID=UPI0034653A0E